VTYRLYFNRCEDFPQIWSIDCGSIDTEINVIGFLALGCAIAPGRAADFAAVDATREPKAWINIQASDVRIDAGVAVFEP